MTRVIKHNDQPADADRRAVALKLEDLAAEARNVVLEARKEAAGIRQRAAAEVEAARRDAAQAGYAEGLARGQHDAREDVHTRVADEVRTELKGEADRLADAARSIVEQFAAAREKLLADARAELLGFAIALAEKIVGRVAQTDVSAAQANMEKALKLAGFDGEVLVRVNPRQLAALRNGCGQFVAAMDRPGGVRLVGDESVSAGGVRAECRSGEIDATIETQLNNVAGALLGAGSYHPVPSALQATGTYTEDS